MKQHSCLPVAHIIAKVYKTINFAPKLVKKILNNIIKSFLPLLLGVVILYWIYEEFDFSLVGVALGDMDLFWLQAASRCVRVFDFYCLCCKPRAASCGRGVALCGARQV